MRGASVTKQRSGRRLGAAVALLLLAAALVAAFAPAADAARRRRKKATTPRRTARAVPRARVGNLHLIVLEPRPEAGLPLPEWAPSNRTVKLIDAYGVKWASHPDSTGLATFTGVYEGRAIVFVDPADSTAIHADTLWIEKGRTLVDTLWFRPESKSTSS